MYSGTGRALFDWIRFAKKDFRFSVLMDLLVMSNFKITHNFCQENNIKLYPSENLFMPGCIDSGIREISDHLAKYSYDFIECVSWANTSTNLHVLVAKQKNQKLVFVPHSQPCWTVPDYKLHFMLSSAFRATLDAADFVFIDSPAEIDLDEFSAVSRDKIYSVPLGVDTKKYCPANSSNKGYQIVCICDFLEKRKRIDLLLDAFTQANAYEPRLRLILAGKNSETLKIPAEIATAVIQLGYIEERSIIELYQSSSLFVLLSDYEAFGLPIAEALCCGCPVLLNKLPVLETLFSSLSGVFFTENQNSQKTAEWICQLVNSSLDREVIAKQAMAKFSFENTYGRKRSILLDTHQSTNI